MDMLSQNMANVDTTRTAEGGPYRRRNVLFQEYKAFDSFNDTLRNTVRSKSSRGLIDADPRRNMGVIVRGITTDPSPGQMVYDPSHPDANEEGYVEKPNVNVVTEMIDMISASRSYEANITAMNITKSMITKTFELTRSQ